MDEDKKDLGRALFHGFQSKELTEDFFDVGVIPDPYYMYAQASKKKIRLDIKHFKNHENSYGDILYSLVCEFKDELYAELIEELQSHCNQVKLDKSKVDAIKKKEYVPSRVKKMNLELIQDIIQEKFKDIPFAVTIADVINFLSDFETRTYYGETEHGALIDTITVRSGDFVVDVHSSKFTDVPTENLLEEYHKTVLSVELKTGYLQGYYPLFKVREWIDELYNEDLLQTEPKVYEIIRSCKHYRWSQGLPYDWDFVTYEEFLNGDYRACFDINDWPNLKVKPFISPHFISEAITNIKFNFMKVCRDRLKELYDSDGDDFFKTLFDDDLQKAILSLDFYEKPFPVIGRRMYTQAEDPDFKKRESYRKQVFAHKWYSSRYGRPLDEQINFFRRCGDLDDSLQTIVNRNLRGTENPIEFDK